MPREAGYLALGYCEGLSHMMGILETALQTM